MSHSPRSTARREAVAKAGLFKIREFKRTLDSHGRPLKPSEYYGCNTFGVGLMSDKLPSDDVEALKLLAKSGHGKLDEDIAERVAFAAKEWALSRGATHYCHWFQPQTGATAEKHDSFFSIEEDGKAIEHFTGKQLVQSEPDASSFPSGGRRSTFEARGYTAWDASSPMFIMETTNGLTLCIPSLFISYHGEALDQKTPLLKAQNALSDASKEALALMGDEVDFVTACAGPEQEYFLVDENFYNLRPDMVLAGRTLLGKEPPKGQQLDDHYFGAIKPRILNFMMECEQELYRLGVPVKTRHNEVAPSQCEAAPIYENANLAADHNQLLMEVFKIVARRHGMRVLFHEKPYAGMNGSGKHLNWSLSDSKGRNLLNPGKKPEENLRFVYFLAASIKAIHSYGGLMRCSVASPGNDFRLGANEAPPAIMSVFLGENLSEVVERIAGGGKGITERDSTINLDLARVPVIARDNTDRNRTSPFAFTGNKFEFRALGSSASISPALTNLNAAVAQSLKGMNKSLSEKSNGKAATEDQILSVIQQTLVESKSVLFEGNNYDEKWHQEAEKRGLPNLRNTPEALEALLGDEVKKMFAETEVYSEGEVDSRFNVLVEQYNKVRMIEMETQIEMVQTHVAPAAVAQLIQIGESVKSLQNMKLDASNLISAADELNKHFTTLQKKTEELKDLVARCSGEEEEISCAHEIGAKAVDLMHAVSTASGEIEILVDDELWSLPKVREMVFVL
ncbi:glutamine synthetase III [Oligoflexaceae bacterium]|nr:glutamine synthetase III [Oligoflexaceae bacterium]